MRVNSTKKLAAQSLLTERPPACNAISDVANDQIISLPDTINNLKHMSRCAVRTHMSIDVHCDTYFGVSHYVLKNFAIHSGIDHVRTERMTIHVRTDMRKRIVRMK